MAKTKEQENLEIVSERFGGKGGVTLDLAFNDNYFEIRKVQKAIAGKDKIQVVYSSEIDKIDKIQVFAGAFFSKIIVHDKNGEKENVSMRAQGPVFDALTELLAGRVELFKEPTNAVKQFTGPAIFGAVFVLTGLATHFVFHGDARFAAATLCLGFVFFIYGISFLIKGNQPRMVYDQESSKWKPASKSKRRE